jgi:hypothetical protein
MTKSIASIAIPDSKLASEAADLLHEYGNPLLWNHSHRDGFKHKPETTFGNIKADVCERYIPGYKSPNFCNLVLQSPWNE